MFPARGMRRAETRSTALSFLFVGCFEAYIRTIRLNYDGFGAIRRNGQSWAVCDRDADDLYFKQSDARLCGYDNSSPHKGEL
jgi:hypothetical protein